MLHQKVTDLLNQQINAEFYSAYLYLNFSNYFQFKGLDGFANWYHVQAQEERDHAMLFYQYLQNNDTPVVLETVEKPEPTGASHLAVLQQGLAHENAVTALIHGIYDVAQQHKDFRTLQFLDWFVKEQGEEEKSASDLITKMELFGGDAKGLYLLDAELAARIYAPPSLVL